ncbi:hypothetical protein [Streptomyces prasinopilosus]|uniref:hypothetical protein n=1 Tax=Streptomyces prasinopilosus TaxID=67344 RepID=UPI0012FE9ECF|nr:hypothetical protein [Streptomyces prasinopilosus]
MSRRAEDPKERSLTREEGEPLDHRHRKTGWNCARESLQAAENGTAEREGGGPSNRRTR